MLSSTRLKVNGPNVVHETIEGEVVIVDLKSGSYYSLDKAGADIWNSLVSGQSIEEMVKGVAQRYDGSEAELEKGIRELAAELVKEDLVVPLSMEEAERLATAIPPPQSDARTGRRTFEIPTLQKYTDMQDLLLLDPIHEVDETGWPNVKEEKA